MGLEELHSVWFMGIKVNLRHRFDKTGMIHSFYLFFHGHAKWLKVPFRITPAKSGNQ